MTGNQLSSNMSIQEELCKEKVIDIKKYLSDVISEYDVIDSVNEELIERGVNI